MRNLKLVLAPDEEQIDGIITHRYHDEVYRIYVIHRIFSSEDGEVEVQTLDGETLTVIDDSPQLSKSVIEAIRTEIQLRHETGGDPLG